jgi:hypothetical protein
MKIPDTRGADNQTMQPAAQGRDSLLAQWYTVGSINLQ